MAVKSIWSDFENWRRYGIERGYNERNPNSLERSDNVAERSWYNFGFRRRWTKNFIMKKLKKSWSKEEILLEIEEFRRETSDPSLPSTTQLRRKKGNGLIHAIYNYFGGMQNLRDYIGGKRLRIGDGKWRDINFSLQHAKRVKESMILDSLPNADILQQIDESSLSAAIVKYHGGFGNFRKLLGEEIKKTDSRDLKNLDYVNREIDLIIKNYELSRLPTTQQLIKIGRSDISLAISKYHGGFRNFRKMRGETLKRRDTGVWKDLEFTLKQAVDIMEKEKWGMLPCHEHLKRGGYSAFATAISVYHGGFPVFRQRLNEYLGRDSEEKGNSLLEQYVGSAQ